MQLALGSLGGSELIIVLVVVLVLFGGSQLPKLARSIGEAQREFKHGLDKEEDEKKPST
jgi:sec-independent protein translocase protein TatA